ncbi:MBL fold metallo-hydrolase [Actinocatenispora thailandica]|uniref:MBL fold metallo-hydrolase n=1 Tax=Actinocatenispora thailandica TaxID=227318 RepID=A0A7R7HXK3_9ACTN|nr:MBL fold metallo-hydrolase [Actinocatenispora thailandica]BCJ35826.1 MBL fold metallo-hydrolase [Actinocatenispora thailandica]
MNPAWQQVADGVHVWRYPVLDVNVTAVSGHDATLVVDTLSTPAQADRLRRALAELAPGRLVLVNTHAHFDHCFGNATLAGPDTEIWAHEATRRRLADQPGQVVAEAAARHADDDPELAGLAAVTPLAPNRTVHERTVLDLGGRRVQLRYGGRGHTDGDLAVLVPDAGVLVLGDLLEVDAPPQFGDAYPISWPATLARLLRDATGPVVPGHGAVVDTGYARRQRDELAELADRIAAGYAAGTPAERVAAAGPFDLPTRREAVARGYAELAG